MPSRWDAATRDWRRKVFDCPQLIQIFINSRSLCIFHSQTPSLMPLKMRKVQLSLFPIARPIPNAEPGSVRWQHAAVPRKLNQFQRVANGYI